MRAMADLQPVYLVHGEDDARLDAWRLRLRRRAEAELGPGGLESFDARSSTPSEVAASLAALTFATGTRYLLVDDAGAWKPGDIEPITDALGAMPPETVLVLIARGKPLADLVKATQGAGGAVHEYAAPKPWELPKWVIERAGEMRLSMGSEAAKALIDRVGPRQQRLARELEKLSIALHPQSAVTPEDVDSLAAGESSPKVYDLADAVVAGDREATISLAQELRSQGERPSAFVRPIVGRLREVRRVVELLDSGVAETDLAKEMKQPPWRVKKAVALARKADRETLERAICRFAELEASLRGGSALDEETNVTLTLARAAA
jgi:DNA polymerase-3 subunit delta